MKTMYKTRNEFGKLFQEYFKTGNGAEIGVQNGYNAKSISNYWKGKIYCIDNWIDQEVFETAIETLKDIWVHFIKMNSVDGASRVENDSLDWVYIDAGHSYPEVKADFEAWFPKVRSGGIISGHDYGENDCIGVKVFIDEYMQLNPEVKMNFTTEDFWEGKEYQSWWFIKK